MKESSKILIIDDSRADQLIIQNILKKYSTISAYDGIEGLDVLEKNNDIDIIILDLNMPRMCGFEVLENIKERFAHLDLSVLILTNYEEIENEIKGLELGAVDYIRKPLNSESLLKRIEVHTTLTHARKEVKHHNMLLEEKVKQRTQELVLTRDITVNALIGLLEVRDIESSNHTRRTQLVMKALAGHLSKKEEYKDILTPEVIDVLFKTAALHDIGKVGIPDKILLKPGKLTDEEFEFMKAHVKFGVDALKSEYINLDSNVFMRTAISLISSHHEKFDGTGYPNALKGKDIPIAGRLMAVIDVYDALISKRVYKEAYDSDYSIAILIEEKGKHFDPDIVDAFVEIKEEINDIFIKYKSKK